MTICPCCGFKANSVLTRASSEGCQSCGARSVGEPLPRAEHELPSYGRSLALAVTGALMILTFLTQTFVALTQISSRGAKSNLAFFSMIPWDFKSWIGAAETAAWQLKWVMIPLTLVVVFGSRKLYRSIQQSPERFCAVRYARSGYLASVAVPLLVLILIGVTVPTRLEHRQWGIEAGDKPYIHRIDRAFDEYRGAFGTLPSEPSDLSRLPDADGSIATALKNLDMSGYKPTGEFAAVPSKKPQQLRGAVIRNASISTADDPPSERLSFTNYDLSLPGPDKVTGTEDDLIVRDGVIYKATETPRRGGNTATTTQVRQP